MEAPGTPSLPAEADNARLVKKVQRAEAGRIKAEKEAQKWKTLYHELNASQQDDEEIVEECSKKDEDGRKPAASVNSRVKSEVKQEAAEGSKNESPSEESERKPAALMSGKRKRDADDQDVDNREIGNESTESESENRDDSAGEGTDSFDALDAATKDWIASLDLENGYGTREAGLNKVGGNLSTYVAPPSFEKVFHLTDFLFPVEEGDESYHLRLFLKGKSKNGIKVRAKLREIKKKSPDDPLVNWHQSGEEWIPPTKEALTGMVRLIVDF